MNVSIFIDGSCNPQTRAGGVGVYMFFEHAKRSISVGYLDTTISRMELSAAITALKAIRPNYKYVFNIHTDSQYVLYCLDRGVNCVANKDLVDELRQLVTDLEQHTTINFIKVPREENRIADLLANSARAAGRFGVILDERVVF